MPDECSTVEEFDAMISRARAQLLAMGFVPGDHYHCLNVKFDSLEEAIKHLESQGYRYGGYQERRLPGGWL